MISARALAAGCLCAVALVADAVSPGDPVTYSVSRLGYEYVPVEGAIMPIWDARADDAPSNIVYGVAAMVRRFAGQGLTVGAQLNGWAGPGITGTTFGAATESVGMAGNRAVLVGLESMVANWEPTNDRPKIGVNIVFNNSMNRSNEKLSGDGSNVNAIGLWFSTYSAQGFESAIKLTKTAISPSRAKPRPAVIDLEDLDPATIAQVDLIRLPEGRAIYFDPETASLKVRAQQ